MQRSMNAKAKEHLQVYNKFQQFIYKVYVFVALLGESSSTSEVQVSSENYASPDSGQDTPASSEVRPVRLENLSAFQTGVPKEQARHGVLGEMKKVFESETTNSNLHNHYACVENNCNKLSETEVSRFTSSRSRDRFVHSWLGDKSLSFCETTGVFWLAYEEGQGMFCFLCKKHNTENAKNKSKVYNSTPSVRFKKSAIKDHSSSQQHRDAIQAEMLSRVSLFHKEVTEKEKVKDAVLLNAFLAAYWLAKEEIANQKFSSLIELLKIVSPENMKFFNYSGEETVRSIFLAIGRALMERLLTNVKEAGCYGLLSDEVTDISVMEILITFVQFFNSKTEKVETHFLFVEDILKNSSSANAETIFNILTEKLNGYGLQLQKLSSMASDGAAVMTGERSGVAARLKEVNSKVITFHCLCHKLALACTDTTSDIDYIKNIELWLRQLWKMFENSPKRMAMYMKVQLQVKSVQLSDKGKKIVGKKLKKACQTRWLSFHAATSALFDDYLAVLQTLGQLKDNDAVACGLLSKVQTAKFIGAIYILNAVLPILSSLSKTFQKGTINFSHIKPSIDYTISKLNEVMQAKSPILDLKKDLLPEGRLNLSEVSLTPSMEEQLSNLLIKYVRSLNENIHRRFDDALPVVSAFSIFDPLAVPNPGSPGFKDYGVKEVKILASHFYPGDTREPQLLAEWEKFKYDLSSWKPAIPDEVKKSHEMTATEWCLTRLMKLQTSFSLVFPALVQIAEVCLSMPVSNAWPERGCSALKRVKTRLRSRLSVEMLQTLLAITINGPKVGTPECDSLMNAAVELLENQKKRRKLPRNRATPIPTASNDAANNTVPAATASVAADAAVQTENDQLMAVSTVTDEVAVATTELNLATDLNRFFDEGIDSDYSELDSGEEDLLFFF